MNTKNTMAVAVAAALGLAAAAWAGCPEGGRMAGGLPCGGGFGRGGGPGCGMEKHGEHMAFAPAENPEIMAARKECRELARKARAAESDEERAALKEQLREKVRAETELVDQLQEKRLDAIAEAAQKRIDALRAQLEEMREHREEFVEEEVERLIQGPRGGKGPHGHRPPPPPPEGDEFGEGEMPPPPRDGMHFGHGHRPPFRGWRGPGKGMKHGAPCGEGPEGSPAEMPEEMPEDLPAGEGPEE